VDRVDGRGREDEEDGETLLDRFGLDEGFEMRMVGLRCVLRVDDLPGVTERCDCVMLRVFPRSMLRVFPRSMLRVFPRSMLRVFPRSMLRVFPRSTLRVFPRSTLRVFPRSTLRVFPRSTLRVFPRSTLRVFPRSTLRELPRDMVPRDPPVDVLPGRTMPPRRVRVSRYVTGV